LPLTTKRAKSRDGREKERHIGGEGRADKWGENKDEGR